MKFLFFLNKKLIFIFPSNREYLEGVTDVILFFNYYTSI